MLQGNLSLHLQLMTMSNLLLSAKVLIVLWIPVPIENKTEPNKAAQDWNF